MGLFSVVPAAFCTVTSVVLPDLRTAMRYLTGPTSDLALLNILPKKPLSSLAAVSLAFSAFGTEVY